MSKRLTEEELVTWGSQPTSCVEARAAPEISELRAENERQFEQLREQKELISGQDELNKKLEADNAGLRVELATAQEILQQERALLTVENDKLKKKIVGLVEFLKNDSFSLVDRISSAIRTVEYDDE